MNNFKFKKFIKNIKTVSLSDEERSVLSNDFSKRTGLRVSVDKDSPKISFIESIFLHQSYFATVAACMVFVLSGGLVVYASKHSLPGDVLYPLKTHVEEPIIRAFNATSPVSKADFEFQLVEERLAEAEQLNQENPLTIDQKTIIKTNIMEQTARAESVAPVATTTKAFSDDSRLQKILKKHHNIVQELNVGEVLNNNRNNSNGTVENATSTKNTDKKQRVNNNSNREREDSRRDGEREQD